MKSNKKKRLYIEYNKKYPDANKKESIGLKKRINKSFKKIKKKDISKQIKYKKRKWKEYLEETEGVKVPIIKKQKNKSIKEFNNIKENENYILAEINIEEDYINEDIRIINTFEEYKRINEFNDININNQINNENIIIGEIFINKNNINKDIRIINSFENFISEHNSLSGDNEYKKNSWKYESEKENIVLKINGTIIEFTYYYKFKEE